MLHLTPATKATDAHREEATVASAPYSATPAEMAKILLTALLLALPFLAIGSRMTYSSWRGREDARLAAIALTQAYERLVASEPGPALPVDQAAHGRDLFASACVACHGADGRGVQGLGKTLVESDFVASLDDDGFREYIIAGRPNAKPMPMPPRAGRDDLTDDDLRAIVTYVRGLQDPRRMPPLPQPSLAVAPVLSDAQKSAALAAAGGDEELAQWIANGDRLFHSVCIACHGKGGVGITGNGKPLTKNAFVQSQDDDELLAFIMKGRMPTDPMNTTGIQMPPKGGNPALSEDDLLDIISYLRSIQGETPTVATNK